MRKIPDSYEMVVFTICGKKLRKKKREWSWSACALWEGFWKRPWHQLAASQQPILQKKKYRKLTFLHKHPQHFHHKPAPVERLAVCVHFWHLHTNESCFFFNLIYIKGLKPWIFSLLALVPLAAVVLYFPAQLMQHGQINTIRFDFKTVKVSIYVHTRESVNLTLYGELVP